MGRKQVLVFGDKEAGKFEVLCRYFCSWTTICAELEMFNLSMLKKKIEDYYNAKYNYSYITGPRTADEIKKSFEAKGEGEVLKAQHISGVEDRNATMLKWLGINYCGQSANPEIENKVEELNQQLLDLSKLIEESGISDRNIDDLQKEIEEEEQNGF